MIVIWSASPNPLYQIRLELWGLDLLWPCYRKIEGKTPNMVCGRMYIVFLLEALLLDPLNTTLCTKTGAENHRININAIAILWPPLRAHGFVITFPTYTFSSDEFILCVWWVSSYIFRICIFLFAYLVVFLFFLFFVTPTKMYMFEFKRET